MALSSLVLLDLVTAILVENARENSENDHVHAIIEKEVEKKNTLRKMKRMFQTLVFTSWFQSLHTHMTGHGSHHSWKEKGLKSCHVWRFLKRRHLPIFAEDTCASHFPDDEPHP